MSQSVIPRPAQLELPGNLTEMQILYPYAINTDSFSVSFLVPLHCSNIQCGCPGYKSMGHHSLLSHRVKCSNQCYSNPYIYSKCRL